MNENDTVRAVIDRLLNISYTVRFQEPSGSCFFDDVIEGAHSVQDAIHKARIHLIKEGWHVRTAPIITVTKWTTYGNTYYQFVQPDVQPASDMTPPTALIRKPKKPQPVALITQATIVPPMFMDRFDSFLDVVLS